MTASTTGFEYDPDLVGSLSLSANAAGVWIFCGVWTARHTRDGLIHGDTLIALPPLKYDLLAATGELVRAELWTHADGGYRMATRLPGSATTAAPIWWYAAP